MSQLKNRRHYDQDGEWPPGITEEEVAFYSKVRQRDIKLALKHYTQRALVGYMILFIAAFANVLYARHKGDQARNAIVRSGNAVAVVGCNRDFVDREKFRSLLVRLKRSADENARRGNATPAQHATAVKFYKDELANYPSIDCRSSVHTVSANPEAPHLALPRPCYTGVDTRVCADKVR